MSRIPHLSQAVVVAATALATSLAVVLPTSLAAASPQPAAGRAKHPPRAISLVGTALHLPGRVVTLPRAAGASPVLLGTVRDGWVVASGGTFRLVRPNGTVRKIAGRNLTDLYVSEALSDDGRRIISTATDQADALSIRVVDLEGTVVFDGWYPNLHGDVMDAARGKVYIGGRRGVRVLEEGSHTVSRQVRRPTALVDLEHDAVFVGSRKHPWIVGPTSLAIPGKPRWRARFDPVAVSPDGRYVVGREGTVRSMKDGRVVRRVAVPTSQDEFRFLGWGSSRQVLVETTVGKQHVLRSCAVPRGACRQVGSTTRFVSLPTRHAGPYRRP